MNLKWKVVELSFAYRSFRAINFRAINFRVINFRVSLTFVSLTFLPSYLPTHGSIYLKV